MNARNNKLFRVGTTETVNLETGESVPAEDGGMMMLPGPPGTCEWCHTEHAADQPHNQQSLAYRVKFETIHGRPPTWTDAMKHCAPEVQAVWRKGLVELMREKGVQVPEDLQGEQG
jgi:hypothetical protein